MSDEEMRQLAKLIAEEMRADMDKHPNVREIRVVLNETPAVAAKNLAATIVRTIRAEVAKGAIPKNWATS